MTIDQLAKTHGRGVIRLLTCAALVLAGPALAQSGGGFEIVSSTLDAGGGVSTGAGFDLNGTAGQSDAGELSGGGYSMQGGFWPTAQGCGACILYADVADPRCIVEIGDVLFILAGYSSGDPCTTHPTADISPCDQPCVIVELADVLAVLNAYAGVYGCSHPCPP